MKMPVKWMMPGLRLALLLMSGGLLAACATKRGAAVQASTASPAVENGAKPKAENAAMPKAEDTRNGSKSEPLVVPGPDGKARVVVTASAVSLQRQKDGPLEELDRPWDFEERDLAEKMKSLAEGVRWSPRGTRVCILREYKRGSDVAVFALAQQPAAEVELDLQILQETTDKLYQNEFRHGRFYYITLARWIDEDHLELDFSGNLVPKSGDDGTNWKSYHGTARIELGAKSGTVQGEPKLGPLTD